MTVEDRLIESLMWYKNDPLGFVKYAFPWGDKKTILAEHDGPDTWQTEFLNEVGNYCKSGITEAFQSARASGHGIGKGAMVSWIILWFMSTRTFPQIVVTANTKSQLETTTWRELSKWHNLVINSHWFKWTATKFYAVSFPETWFAAAIPWSKEHSESFAGKHDVNTLVIFDESSAIDDKIWEVASGAMSTPYAMWMVFGNPTLNTGRFRECFGARKHRWKTKQIDSRTAKMTNKRQIEEDIKEYGEDSDFVRVRWRGEFPRVSTAQFISSELVENAMKRNYQPSEYNFAPITIGVDVARYGIDQTVICVRQGIKVHEIKRFRELDTMQVASHVAATEDEYRNLSNLIVTYVDVVGIGAGVVDRLRQIGRDPIAVNAGSSPTSGKKYFNKRAEMWGVTRDWLQEGGQLPDDKELFYDLTSPEYGYSPKEQIQIEKKEDMKARGLSSPDSGDALVLTFSYPIADNIISLSYGDGYCENWRDPLRSTSITGY